MFSPLAYSYGVDDAYDTRKLNEIKYFYSILLYLSPTVTTTNESPTKKSSKRIFSF
jgi:hypothetical protein